MKIKHKHKTLCETGRGLNLLADATYTFFIATVIMMPSAHLMIWPHLLLRFTFSEICKIPSHDFSYESETPKNDYALFESTE